MKNKHFMITSEKLYKDYQIDIIEDILLSSKDRVLLYGDISKENIELFVISGTLELIGFPDSNSIKLTTFLDYIDLSNKYAEIAGKNEYLAYVRNQLFSFTDHFSFTIPILKNKNRVWVNISFELVKDHPQICIFYISNLTTMMIEEEKNFYKSHTDSLTGLLNRYTFDYHYGLRYKKENLHVIYLDIDNFKEINDTFGHATGNQYLIALAKVLKSHQSNYNLFYRLGGDEFVGLFFEEEEKIKTMVKQLLIEISQIELIEKAIHTTASIGVVQATIGEDLARKADDLMYEVKKSGKNNFIYRIET